MYKVYILIIVFSFFILFALALNPCTDYEPLNGLCRRHMRNVFRPWTEIPLSDTDIKTTSFYGSRGFKMADTPVPTQRCGTYFPIWLKDLPEKGQPGKGYKATACVTSSSDICSVRLRVVVYFCQHLQVYKLEQPPSESAYCLDYSDDQYGNNSCLSSVRCEYQSGINPCMCLKLDGRTVCQDKSYLCNTRPCLNFGTCLYGLANYTCKCAPGYTGRRCGKVVDFCSRVTCLNSGRCINAVHKFMCKCKKGFTGELCESVVSDNVGVLAALTTICLMFLSVALFIIFRLLQRLREKMNMAKMSTSESSYEGTPMSKSVSESLLSFTAQSREGDRL